MEFIELVIINFIQVKYWVFQFISQDGVTLIVAKKAVF